MGPFVISKRFLNIGDKQMLELTPDQILLVARVGLTAALIGNLVALSFLTHMFYRGTPDPGERKRHPP